MKLNGNLVLNSDGSGNLQNITIDPFSTAPVSNLFDGRLYYNTTSKTYWYYDISALAWIQFAEGSSTVASFQTSLSGLTPATATTGAVTLAGTLNPNSGGTGAAGSLTGYVFAPGSNAAFTASTSIPASALSGIVSVANGGTGDSTLAVNGVLVGDGTSPVTTITGSQYQVLVAGSGGVPAFGQVSLGQAAAVTGILPLANGGTNASLTAVAGGFVYSGSSALAITAAGTAGQFVLSGGAGAPTYLTNSTPIDTDADGVSDLVVGSTFNLLGTANQITTTAVASPVGVTLSVPTTFIAPGTVTVTSTLTVDGLTYESSATGITAHAGGGQGSATALTKSYNVVTTVATSGDSVVLPASGGGLEITVVNIGSNTLAVFPASGDQIDGGTTNASVNIPSGGTATYQSVNSGNWYTIDPVVVTTGAGLSVLYSPGETVLSNTGVTSFSGGTTGLSTASTGALTLTGTLVVANGGTGATTFTSDGVLYGNGTGAVQATAAGTTGEVLGNVSGVPTWQSLAGIGVTSFQTSLSGLTPSIATTGVVTLAGTLGVASGGTGDVTLTTNGVLFGNGTSAVGQTAAGVQYNVLVANVSGVPTFGTLNLASTAAVGSSILALANGGTNAALTAVAGGNVYSTGSALAISAAGTTGQALISGGTASPTWQTVASTLTTNQILEGDGTGQFVANGASFVGSGTFSGVTLQGTVTNPTDATTKAYVDASIAGLTWKDAVRALAATNIALTGGATLTIDGYSVQNGDRVLLTGETSGVNNGIYVASGIGSAYTLTRSTDMASGSNADNDSMFVIDGTVYGNTAWVQTSDPALVGTNSLTFAQFAGSSTYTAGPGLALTGTVFSAKTDGVTIYVNGSNQLAVDSSATAGQTLLSTGTAGTTATWGSLNLANTSAVTGTLAVGNGGTGDTTFTTNGVLFGNGTSALEATAAGASGTVLTGTGSAPVFTALNTIAVTSFNTTLSGLTPSTGTEGAVTLAGTLGVPSGGTGATTLTAHGVLLGEGTGAVVATAVGATGQVLTGVTGADPVWTNLSSVGVTSVTGTANEITATPTTGNVVVSLPSTVILPGTLEVTSTSKFDALTYETTANVTATGSFPALTAAFNIVTTTGSGQGVTLPVPAFGGAEISVVNVGANSISVFPNTGAAIDAGSVNAAITIPAGGTWTGQASTTTQWYSIDPVVVNGTGISVTYSNGQTSVSNTGVLSFSGGTTGLTPASATAGNVVLAGILAAANGGTGVNNGSDTITLGGNINTGGALTTVGAFTTAGSGSLTFTTSGTTNVTIPSGSSTMVTSSNVATYAVTTVSLNTVTTPDANILTVAPTAATDGVVAETITFNNQTANTVLAGPHTGGVSATGYFFPGSGYAPGTYTAVPLTGGTGSGAQATIVVTGTVVTSVTITTAGTGYQVGDNLGVDNATQLGGTGTGFFVNVTGVSVTAAQPLFRKLSVGDLPNIYFLYQNATPGTSFTVSHNLGQKYCNVTVVDTTDEVIIPQSITFNDQNTLTVTFTMSIACSVIVMGVA